MKIGCFSSIVILWTLAAVILNLSGVGKFAEWELTAWPWHWSCMFAMYWFIIGSIFGLLAAVIWYSYKNWRTERLINSYPLEQRAFVRRALMMKKP